MKDIVVFFFNDTATTEIYTLSLHDALPICAGLDLHDPGGDLRHLELEEAEDEARVRAGHDDLRALRGLADLDDVRLQADRKSTRLNSSHANISYAVFCLKKKIVLEYCCQHQ